jgi:GT2 family glycosyltransferase
MRASVAVLVKNGAAHLPAVLAALEEQDLAGGLEIVAVDSGSTDGSLEILQRPSVRLLTIPAASFDHGETRNLAAREARGRSVVFLSQDAVPVDRGFARALVETLEADQRLAGAFARQVPRPDADPLTRRDLRAWVASGEEPRVVFAPRAYASLPPVDRYRLAVFDNVASAVSRDLLLAHPFSPSRFGEDVEWGDRMLRLGRGLAYVPSATVIHSHARTARGLFRRNYLGHRLLHRLFGLRTVPDFAHLLRAAGGAMASDLRTLARDRVAPGAWLVAPAQALAATYGQYRGALDEVRGRPYPEWA